MVMAQKQATGTKKSSEKNAHYLLTIMTITTKRTASKQRQFKKVVRKMLTICSLSRPGEQKGIKQATGAPQKSSEQNARYLLTIITRREP